MKHKEEFKIQQFTGFQNKAHNSSSKTTQESE